MSQRLPITVLETVLSNAERRAVLHREKTVVPRVSDVYASLPSITGKIELEYEGELQGATVIASDLIRRACKGTFEARAGGADVEPIVGWFDSGSALKVADEERTDLLLEAFSSVPGLLSLVQRTGLAPTRDAGAVVAACELTLEGLVAQKRISRNDQLGYVMARRERGPGTGGSGLSGPSLFA